MSAPGAVHKLSLLDVDQKREEISKDDVEVNTWFEDTFLDAKHKLKKEIHEKLRSFPWLRGAYGLTGPNKKIRRPHIFLTVERGMTKSDVRDELVDKFECDPKKYFELLQVPKREPKVKYLVLVQPTPGGAVLACSPGSSNSSNPLRVPEESEVGNSPQVQGTGTLTMFCSPNGHHYALTCFHVGCANDVNRLNSAFNKVEDIQMIRNSLDDYVNYAKKQKYYFQEGGCVVQNNDEPISFGDDGNSYTLLGEFDNYRFDEECDILSLKIPDDIEVDCNVEDVHCPDWEKIQDELYQRVIKRIGENPVKVEKFGFSSALTHGEIVISDFNYIDGDNPLFQDAVVVKGCPTPGNEIAGCPGPFLEGGDSGSLVFFRDAEGRKQVFAYGVCEVDKLTLPKQQEPTSFKDYVDNSDVSFCTSEQGESISSNDDDDDASSIWSDDDFLESDDEDNVNDLKVIFKDDDIGENSTESYFICLRLDTALENLGLEAAACLNCCSKTLN